MKTTHRIATGIVFLFLCSAKMLNATQEPSATGRPPEKPTYFEPATFIGSLEKAGLLFNTVQFNRLNPELQDALKQANQEKPFDKPVSARAVAAPKPKFTPQPVYPFEQRRSGTAGKARFVFVVNTSGGTEGIYCVSATHPNFAEKGAEAVAKWQFLPATAPGGNPAACIVEQTLEFGLKGK